MCTSEVAEVCNCTLNEIKLAIPPRFQQAMSDIDNPKSTDSRESAKVSPLNVSEKIYSTPSGAGRPRLKLHATARNLAGKNRQNGYDLKVAAKSAVEKIFAIYDVDKSGYLDPSELKKLLTKYHDGIPPDDQTVNFIIRMCDWTNRIANPQDIRKYLKLLQSQQTHQWLQLYCSRLLLS